MNYKAYSPVVLPLICMIHLHSLEISLLLNGLTRTATFTDDIFIDLVQLKQKLLLIYFRV